MSDRDTALKLLAEQDIPAEYRPTIENLINKHPLPWEVAQLIIRMHEKKYLSGPLALSIIQFIPNEHLVKFEKALDHLDTSARQHNRGLGTVDESSPYLPKMKIIIELMAKHAEPVDFIDAVIMLNQCKIEKSLRNPILSALMNTAKPVSVAQDIKTAREEERLTMDFLNPMLQLNSVRRPSTEVAINALTSQTVFRRVHSDSELPSSRGFSSELETNADSAFKQG